MLAVLLACTLKVIFSARTASPAGNDFGESENLEVVPPPSSHRIGTGPPEFIEGDK